MEKETFGERLKLLRTGRNLLQSEFGEIIGEFAGCKKLSASAIGAYERNEREPAYAYLKAFADYFGVSTDYLLCHSDERLTVERYLESNSIELKKALSDFPLTIDGREITDSEKARIYDIAFALLWRN